MDFALKMETLDGEKNIKLLGFKSIQWKIKKKLLHSNLERTKEGTMEVSEVFHHNTGVVEEVDIINLKIGMHHITRHNLKGEDSVGKGQTTPNNANKGQATGKWCSKCRKVTHITAQCWSKTKMITLLKEKNITNNESSKQKMIPKLKLQSAHSMNQKTKI